MEPTADRNQGPGADISTRDLIDMGCGRKIGRYTLLRRIAAGGMAEVYTAFSKGLMAGFEKKVAIKKILPQHSHNERFIDMLVDEAKITVSLTHPNIAQVFELGLDGEDYFIVMEYVDGRPLNRLMQRVDERGLNVIPVEFAAHVMAEIAKGLEHAHNQKDQRGRPLGIVHRDVSPQNVLIAWPGEVKLIDFGIARAEGRVNQTSQGVIKGKLRYLAPEIAAGDEPDHRADIFCCGIVLFEMLTGEAMFAPKTDLEAIELATQARVKSPRSRNPKVPQDLDDIVMKALARDRGDRYQSAKDLYRDLRRFLNQHDPSFVGSELGDFMREMFEQEIVSDRELDDSAERIAKQRSEGIEEEDEEEDPTLAATPGALAGERSYKQLVTRLGIGAATPVNPNHANQEEKFHLVGADGGRPMSIIVADPAARPLIRDGSVSEPQHQGTLPPKERMSSYGSPGEPTVRADNPFISSGASGLPTVTAPVPSNVLDTYLPDSLLPEFTDTHDDPPPNGISFADRADRAEKADKPSAPQRTTSLNIWETRSSDAIIPADPTFKNNFKTIKTTFEDGIDRISNLRGPNLVYALAFIAIVLAMGGTAWLISPTPDEEQPVVIKAQPDQPDPTIELPPIAIGEESGEIGAEKAAVAGAAAPAIIRLTVKPVGVRVIVTVDGLTRASQERAPLELGPFTADQLHAIVVSADGYVTKEFKRVLAGGRNDLDVRLEPAFGKILLKGTRQGTVEISHGRLKKDQIVDIPLDSNVRIAVEWPGAKPFETTVEVKTLDPITVAVPPPKRLAKGTLVINSRPISEVYVDRKFIGKTPRRIRLSAGTHRVMLKSPDGEVMSFTRKINPGKKTTFTYQWR